MTEAYQMYLYQFIVIIIFKTSLIIFRGCWIINSLFWKLGNKKEELSIYPAFPYELYLKVTQSWWREVSLCRGIQDTKKKKKNLIKLEQHHFSTLNELADLGNNHQQAALITKRETPRHSIPPNKKYTAPVIILLTKNWIWFRSSSWNYQFTERVGIVEDIKWHHKKVINKIQT